MQRACSRAFQGAGKGIKVLECIQVLFTKVEVDSGEWSVFGMMGHEADQGIYWIYLVAMRSLISRSSIRSQS